MGVLVLGGYGIALHSHVISTQVAIGYSSFSRKVWPWAELDWEECC